MKFKRGHKFEVGAGNPFVFKLRGPLVEITVDIIESSSSRLVELLNQKICRTELNYPTSEYWLLGEIPSSFEGTYIVRWSCYNDVCYIEELYIPVSWWQRLA